MWARLFFCCSAGLLINPAAFGEAFDHRDNVPSGRHVIDIEQGWRFARGDHPGAESPDFDDRQWQMVDVPHDWAIAGPFDEENPASGEGGFLPTGAAWYRKPLSLSAEHEGSKVLVEFDGVMANSDVWINGHKLGHRPNGYVSFRYDLTEHLKFGDGATNTLAVRTDTSDQVASRWYTGSGIYRHVRLLSFNPLHFDYGGIYVTTPVVNNQQATLQIKLSVLNEHQAERELTIRSTLLDEAGNVVEITESALRVDGRKEVQAVQSLEVESPHLWSVDNPYLYTVQSRILSEGIPVDELSTHVGIRSAEFRSDSGFWINGENIKLKGVCLHHCAGALGAAVPVAVWEFRLSRLKELGVNAIRTAHNPVAPEFLDLCDRMGFLVMDEFFDCWTIGKRPGDYHLHFKDWAHRDMRDTILRDRNHPSIVLYSVGNEIRDTHKQDLARQILQGLVDVCHQTDSTRPVTQGLFRPNTTHDYDNGLADTLDVIGTNYRDLELLQAWHDNPARKIVGTEQAHDRKIWLACRDNPQHSGQFLWTGIDYLGESPRWPITTFNSGLLDRTGRVRPRGYERQSWWSPQPMVRAFRRVAPTEATPQDPGYETVEWQRPQVLFSDWSPSNRGDHTENVEVYSNCEEVELQLNGESLGSKPLPGDARPRNWRVAYAPGKLVAIGRNGGQEAVRHELNTAGAAHHVLLNVSNKELTPDWDDVAIVEATVVDSSGVRVPNSAHEITFEVSGPGEIIAVDNGSIISHEPFHSTHRQAYQGRCVAIVRASAGTGEFVVTASADGLESGNAEFTCQ